MKKIDLEEILDKYINVEVFGNIFPDTIEVIFKAMKEACNQTIELCAKNAEIKKIDLSTEYDDYYEFIVNTESILKTKTQIK
jgi:hypothetical protein